MNELNQAKRNLRKSEIMYLVYKQDYLKRKRLVKKLEGVEKLLV